MALGDWDQAVETAGRCLAQDPTCIDATIVIILHKLLRTGQTQEARRV